MDCQGVWGSGTAYITFEDVKVPVENLLGKENKGFKGKHVQFLLSKQYI
jgi:alkylation response protein AidB-like acyl-CoA dehydrogenase